MLAARVGARAALRRGFRSSAASCISIGDTFPSSLTLHQPNDPVAFDPIRIDMDERLSGKKVMLVGLVPGYLDHEDALKAAGVDEVIIFCVNDACVMKAWSLDQMVEGSDFLHMMGDPDASVTKALDVVLEHPGPMSKLGYPRTKRCAMFVDNGIVKILEIAEAEEDPAGDDFPDVTLAENMIAKIKAL